MAVSQVLMFRADTASQKNDAQLKGEIIDLSFLKDWTDVFNIGLLVDILISNSFNKKKTTNRVLFVRVFVPKVEGSKKKLLESVI